MTLEIISLHENFELGANNFAKMPFVLDRNTGQPDEAINRYIRKECLKNKNIEKTVRRKVTNIVDYCNYLQQGIVIGFSDRKSYKYNESTEATITAYKNSLNDRLSSPKTKNKYIYDVFQFLWFCEHEESDTNCLGVIGITDVGKGIGKYPVPVHAPNNKKDSYKIDKIHFFDETKSGSQKRGDIREDWDSALEKASDGDKPENIRDTLILRLIRSVNLRRIAVGNLPTSEFERELTDNEIQVGEKYIFIAKDKYDKAHWQPLTTDLYSDIRDYIGTVRPELLIKGDDNNPYLFNGKAKGKPLSERQIYGRLSQLGVEPHDGRRLGLTEAFMHYIASGLDRTECMHMVKQLANHSVKSDETLLMNSYLQAKLIVNKDDFTPVSELKFKIKQQEHRIRELENSLAQVEPRI